MVDGTEKRLAKVRKAERAIAGARSTERNFLREPEDARLDEMAVKVAQLVETCVDDGTRWAAR